MRRITIVTGTRAEYGLLKPIIDRVLDDKNLHLDLLVTGMHLSPEYGYTVKHIEDDGVPIAAKVEMQLSSDSAAAMAKGMGLGLYGITHEMERLQPDIVLILGDRVEAFAGAIAGLFCGALVGHIHGGEITQGGLDEYMRHAITKLSHIHFAATEKSAERIIGMGEDPKNVHCTGAPGLDALLQYPKMTENELSEALGIPIPDQFALVVQHPVSTHPETARDEIKATLEALKSREIYGILTYPNSDAGSREMIQVIEQYAEQDWLVTFKSLTRPIFANLMRRAAVLVGNSSSGMLDAPSFSTPVINIGERQEGREQGSNILDAPAEQTAIEQALERIVSDEIFLQQCRKAKNPYGDGKASERIVKILKEVDLLVPKKDKRMS